MKSLLFFSLAIVLFACTEPANKNLPFIGPIDFNDSGDTIQHQLKDFMLLNQLGDTVSLDIVHGKVHVAEFFFSSCPGICPIMKAKMKTVYNTFLNDSNFHVLSFTVDPERDTVEAIRAYGEDLEIDPNKWSLLTGSRFELERVARDSYLQLSLKDSLSLNHSQQFILVDKNQHIRGIYDGIDSASVELMKKDITFLLNESNGTERRE